MGLELVPVAKVEPPKIEICVLTLSGKTGLVPVPPNVSTANFSTGKFKPTKLKSIELSLLSPFIEIVPEVDFN